MTTSDDHGLLAKYVDDTIQALLRAPGLQRGGTVHYHHHTEFGQRSHDLGLILQAAVKLAGLCLYPQSFALLRGALEHRLFDSQLFLATTVRDRRDGVSEEDFQAWERQRQTDPNLKRAIRKLSRNNGGQVEIVWDGPWVVDEQGRREYRLSVFYGYMQLFSPFSLSDRLQPRLARHFSDVERHVAEARRNQRLWFNVRWDKLLDTAVFNRSVSKGDALKLEVHYGFLSSFVHPFTLAANRDAFGDDPWRSTPYYDHYASELVLLYAASLAAWELQDFVRTSKRRPLAPLLSAADLEALAADREKHAAYLWFVGDQPHRYDYVREANDRGMKNGRLLPRNKRPGPSDLRPSQVRYYRNPLRRLIDMHHSFHEITGFGFRSDWERTDHRRR